MSKSSIAYKKAKARKRAKLKYQLTREVRNRFGGRLSKAWAKIYRRSLKKYCQSYPFDKVRLV